MGKVIKLYICHKCHKRITKGQGFTKYKFESIYHDECFAQYIDEFDLSQFTITGVMTVDDEG